MQEPTLAFNQNKVLPPGDYDMTLEQLERSLLVVGPGDRDWDTKWRKQLVMNLRVLVGHLRQIGITEIFIDGSFVERKNRPNDIDGYFECHPSLLVNNRLQQELNNAANQMIWSWDPILMEGDPKPRLLMWHVYHVELYPHYGQSSRIPGPNGHSQKFPAAFRRSRKGKPKGIIHLIQ